MVEDDKSVIKITGRINHGQVVKIVFKTKFITFRGFSWNKRTFQCKHFLGKHPGSHDLPGPEVWNLGLLRIGCLSFSCTSGASNHSMDRKNLERKHARTPWNINKLRKYRSLWLRTDRKLFLHFHPSITFEKTFQNYTNYGICALAFSEKGN